jgi:hypothetical protein
MINNHTVTTENNYYQTEIVEKDADAKSSETSEENPTEPLRENWQGTSIEELEKGLEQAQGKFIWAIHNELRHHLHATDLTKSIEHTNTILEHSVMDGYMLNILSDW